ncbi:MAG: hypothetical protein PHW18_07735 [Sulfuricurvum sp.]|uniref:hypothetical protein n=1 Tax=Sulfuricurvum sp. TaxID=2025608 RepID=UPI002621E92E|nr:hypothetical protein [Sulfuricurvum sp.]MDD2829446.1 hypothetical protein [Sulfuricurvum sp.]MDD4948471.1 hypothetical protein [Sulfuricurvum sp.]
MPNSRLPHKEPLIFVESLLEQSDTEVTFRSSFPLTPTLAMFCEASAQGTSYFPLSPHCNIGFVSSFRNVILEEKANVCNPLITITLLHSFNDSYLFKFRAFNGLSTFATGEIAMFYMAA